MGGSSAKTFPTKSNRVDLSDALVDGDGLHAPRITYAISDNTRKMLAFHTARAVEAMEAAGGRRDRGDAP